MSVGDRVRIIGGSLAGSMGRLCQYVASRRRWAVQLDSGEKLAIYPVALEVEPERAHQAPVSMPRHSKLYGQGVEQRLHDSAEAFRGCQLDIDRMRAAARQAARSQSRAEVATSELPIDPEKVELREVMMDISQSLTRCSILATHYFLRALFLKQIANDSA